MSQQQEVLTKPKRCGKYGFKLIGKGKVYIKGPVVVDYKAPNKTKKIEKKTVIPTFNTDKKFYTPAFVLPAFSNLEHEDKMLQDHMKRVSESTSENEQIYVPKPRSRQQYCGVCREYYQEYMEHVEGEKHLEKLRNSPFQRYLIQQSLKYQANNLQIVTPEPEKEETKLSSSQTSCQTIIQQPEQDIGAYLNLNFN